MEIQVALDRLEPEYGIATARMVSPFVDWIEVGTSMIKRCGASYISEVAAAIGDVPVLADLKVVDDAEWELELAYGSGAASATVLGLAPWPTIEKAIHTAQRWGRELVVDVMGLDAAHKAGLDSRLPPDVVIAEHTGKDEQALLGPGRTAPPRVGRYGSGRRLAVAGGLGPADLSGYVGTDVRVIVGAAVTKSNDPSAMAGRLRAAARQPAAPRAMASGEGPNSDPGNRVDAGSLLRPVLAEISVAADRLDEGPLAVLVDAVSSAKHVVVTGEGRSGFMAKSFAMRLMHLGVDVDVLGETTTPALSMHDTLVAISGSGATEATVRAANRARQLGAAVIVLTTATESPLAQDAHVVLIPGATKHRKGGEVLSVQPLSSLFDQMTHLCLDAVCLRLSQLRSVSNETAKLRHANTE